MSLSTTPRTAAARVSEIEPLLDEAIKLPKVPSLKSEGAKDPSVFLVQDRSGSLPPPPPGNQPLPPVAAQPPPANALAPNVAALANKIRERFFDTVDATANALAKEMNPLTADLALGGPGKYAAAVQKRTDAVAAAEKKWNELALPQFKTLDETQKELIGLLAANGGRPEGSKEIIDIFKAKLVKAAGLKSADGIPFPEGPWTEDTVRNAVLYLKNDAVQMRMGERQFLLGIGSNAFGEKGAKFTMPGDLSPTQSAQITRYLKNKYGEDPNSEDPKVLANARDLLWDEYRTGVFGAGTAGRIDKEIPQGPLDAAGKAYIDLKGAFTAFEETGTLVRARMPLVGKRFADPNEKDPTIVRAKEILGKARQTNMDALLAANKELKSIGAPPITNEDLTARYMPKTAEPKK